MDYFRAAHLWACPDGPSRTRRSNLLPADLSLTLSPSLSMLQELTCLLPLITELFWGIAGLLFYRAEAIQFRYK